MKKTDDTPMTGTSQKTRGGADSRVRKPSKYLSYPYTSSGLISFTAETEGTPKESLSSTKLDIRSKMKRKKTKPENAARRKMKSSSGPSDTNTNASEGDHTSSGKELKQKRKVEKMTSVHQLQNEEITVNETGNNCSLVSEISQNHSSLASKKKQKLDVAQLHQGAQFVWHLDAKGTECSPLVVDLQNKGIGENKEEKVPKVANPPAAAAPPMEHFMTLPLDLQNKSIGENKEEHVPKVSNHPAAVAPPLEHSTPTQPTRPMSISVETSPTLQLFDQILHKMSLVLEKLRE